MSRERTNVVLGAASGMGAAVAGMLPGPLVLADVKPSSADMPSHLCYPGLQRRIRRSVPFCRFLDCHELTIHRDHRCFGNPAMTPGEMERRVLASMRLRDARFPKEQRRCVSCRRLRRLLVFVEAVA